MNFRRIYLMNQWSVREPDAVKISDIVRKTDLGKTVASVLVARGYGSVDEIAEFLEEKELSSPYLIRDMQAAAEYILEAVEEGKRICVYGDYDCDGIMSTVMLYSYLSLTGADVTYYIPEREEGYGLNENRIRKIAEEGTDLIITVDNGIASVKEAELIKELGMELVVTDHHQPSDEIPDAVAVVDPHRKDCHSPYKNLCGAGVTLKLIAAMEGGDYEVALEQFGEYAALATIADVMTLDGENRYIVRRGLEYLKNTENCGLRALMREVKLAPEKINSTSVAFNINPKINVAGRMSSPTRAVKLFLSEDEDEATEIARELIECVSERKRYEVEALSEIDEKINKYPEILNDRVLIFYGNDWHHGVSGLVSAKITDRYGKPSCIISVSDGMARGSARTVQGFSLFNALSSCSEIYEKFGGHTGACGFSLKEEKIDEFIKRINLYARENHNIMPSPVIIADKYLEKEDMTLSSVKGLSVLEPFGEGNPEPLFLAPEVAIEEKVLFAEKHLKLKLSYKGTSFYTKLWNTLPSEFPFAIGDKIDLILTLDINVWNDKETVEYSIKDYRKSGLSQEKYMNAKHYYESYRLGEGISPKLRPIIVPDREDFVAVYKALSSYKSAFEKGKPIDSLFAEVFSDKLNYFKFRIILDSFEELSLARVDYAKRMVYLLKTEKKVDLESAEALKKIKSV